jgi:hypothetical protein
MNGFKMSDIHWLAGLLEGEGSFTRGRQGNGNRRYYPMINLKMTDEDIIRRVAEIWGGRAVFKYHPKDKNKQVTYQTQITGKRALGWMMLLWTLLGQRRRERISGLIREFT